MTKFYIYKVTNKINGKIYIGKSKNPSKRWVSHLSTARNPETNKDGNIYFYMAIRKHGEKNFNFVVIDEFNDEKLCLQAEIDYIAKFNSNDRNIGYNLTIGGDGAAGYKHSEESKKKMSDTKKRTFLGENNPFFGKNHSEETKAKLSAANKGKHAGEKNPFFGKKHPPEIIQIIIEKNKAQSKLFPRFGEKAPFFGHKHSKETKERISKNSATKPLFNKNQANDIRELYNTNQMNQKQLAKKYDTNTVTIRNILKFRGAYSKS